MPNLSFQAAMLRNPFQNPYLGEDGYIWWNWLSPFLAHTVGIRSVHAYFVFCLVIALAIIPVVYAYFRERLDDSNARWRLLLFTCFPCCFAAFYWVGMDALTMLLLVLMVRSMSRWPLAVGYGLFLGFQHAEQAAIAIALLAATRWLLDTDASPLRGPIAALLGVMVGRGLLGILAARAVDPPPTRLGYYFTHHSSILLSFVVHLPVVLWAIFGAGWLVWVKGRLNKSERLVVGILLAASILLSATTMDKTRVTSVAILPALLALLASPSFDLAELRATLAPVIALAIVVPVVWVWGGVFSNLLPFDLTYLVRELFGHPHISPPLDNWPFRT